MITSLARGLAACLALASLAAAGSDPVQAGATRPVRAFWVSPDWLLFGDRRYSHGEVRALVDRAVAAAAAHGANALFVESLLRGQLVGPCPAAGATLPVYPLVRWDWKVEDGRVHDILSMFVDAGRSRGLQVHAWIHALYWRSDNESFRKAWHDGPTLWDDRLVAYLDHVAARVRSLPRRRAAADLARAIRGGFWWASWKKALARWTVGSFEGSMNNLVRFIESGDGPPPEFLLTNPAGELHFGMEHDRFLSIYLNPEDPVVAGRLVDSVAQLAGTHAGLAGVHLDHMRYPKGPFGGPGTFDAFPRAMRTTLYRPARHEVGPRFDDLVARRERVLTDIVARIRARVPAELALSAAVYPTYYRARDARDGPIDDEAWLGQAWAGWPVDFVVPMVYGASPGRVERLIAECRRAAADHAPGPPPAVHPGISSPALARSWGRSRSWVLFDFQGFAGLLDGIPGSAVPSMRLGDRIF
jgi:uncharacterized lipoprotein YddW (UPF0748 family)